MNTEKEPGEFVTVHILKFTDTKRNCEVCYNIIASI